MAYVGAIIVVTLFLVLVKVFRLVDKSSQVIKIAQSAALMLLDNNISDRQKETAMQAYARELLTLFLVITGASVAALLAPFGLIWLMELAEVITIEAVNEVLLSWQFIAATVILSGIYLWITNKNTTSETFESQHSTFDQFLHHIVFGTWSLQVSLSNLETRIFKKHVDTIPLSKPVFITGLPRAGTTLLLDICAQGDEFATNTYGDMPFFLTPLFWGKASQRLRKANQPHERVHGDGMLVDANSPEAFEEIIWKGFWPSRYQTKRIVPWSEPSYPTFESFFRNHLRKLIHLRSQPNLQSMRYISKNNQNIARINYLKQVFPDAIIVVPFRDPFQQATSLLRQHRNFLRIHDEDPFARKYMADTGHFDFGRNLKPIDFDGWLSEGQAFEAETLAFWIQYWTHVYGYLLNYSQDNVRFFSYDVFCQDPENGLKRLADILDVKEADFLTNQAERVRRPKLYDIDLDKLPAELVNNAGQIQQHLQAMQAN